MSTKHALNSSIQFDVLPGHSRNPELSDFSNSTHYQLEYLDLSSVGEHEEDISCSPGEHKSRSILPLAEAEFYSFEDYLPNCAAAVDADYENVYGENNNHIQVDYTTRSSGSKYYSCEASDTHLGWRIGSDLRNTSRAGSTCSGSSSSSQSLGNSQIFQQSHPIVKHNPNLPSVSSTAQKNWNKFPHSTSSTALVNSIYDMYPAVRKSLSTDSFRKLHSSGHSIAELQKPNIIGSTNAGSIPSHHLTKVKPDNQQASSSRTEELLNGIVKLAEDTVDLPHFPKIKHSTHHPKEQVKKKPPLQTSKSTPLFSSSAQSTANSGKNGSTKPSSPVATSKRFTFSRKGSFHGGADHDRKVDKKNKLTEKNSHLNAYLNAVERFDLDQVAHLLSVDSSCVNSLNSEGLAALDMAVLTNHVPMINALQKYGAQTKFLDGLMEKSLLSSLEKWINIAEKQLAQLRSGSTSGSSKDNEKKVTQWEFKHRLFRRMKSGYEQAGLPGQPQNVKLSVTSDSSLSVRFDAPNDSNNVIVTRYKVEWCKAQNFRPIVGEVIINEMHNLQRDITGLECGTPYYVRVTAWNVKGFGRSSNSDPLYAIPSSWRDVENLESRTSSVKQHEIYQIIEEFRKGRRNDSTSERPTSSGSSQQYLDSPPNNRKSALRGLRGLFSSSFKFQKSLKRGVYLACVCFNEDKILVTTEENLPIIEVEESYSSHSLQSEFDWLMKVVTSSWDTARQLKQDLEKLELSSMQLRSQLLTAVLQLQELIGIQDLGQLFYKPIYDGNGSVVIAVVNHITDAKQVGNIASAVKWQSQNKLTKNSQPSDPLLPLLNEMIFFGQVSTNQLPRGLYIGYLHIKFNTESVRVLAPENNPSVLPFIKMRDCPNVSRPEWKSILDMSSGKLKLDSPDILLFKKQLLKSSRKLATKLGIPAEQLDGHRIYDVEVLDFSSNVSFILLLPPRDLVCSVKAQPISTAMEPSSEYMEIPIKAFEMVHLQTYQADFVAAFSKAACLVDSQLVLAQQSQREAFSNEEIEVSRKQVEAARTCHHQLEEIWRPTRWLADAISYARDRDGTSPGLSLANLCNFIAGQSSNTHLPGDGYGKNLDEGYHSDKISLGGSTSSEKVHPTISSMVVTQNNTNNNNGQYYDEQDWSKQSAATACEQPKPGILRVYAAYESGLAKGTSVMLHVTPRTTAREVIDLVIMQLNKEVIRKGLSGPTYVNYELLDFCLVAVIGPRERVLRDDYRLLQLQNPWIKGKLFVRTKDNLLAALTQGETTNV